MKRVAALIALSVCAAALAQTATVVRIRGNVESLEGNTLTVKARNGERMKVHLAEHAVVMGITKGSVSDVQTGKFVGTTTVGERQPSQTSQNAPANVTIHGSGIVALTLAARST